MVNRGLGVAFHEVCCLVTSSTSIISQTEMEASAPVDTKVQPSAVNARLVTS